MQVKNNRAPFLNNNKPNTKEIAYIKIVKNKVGYFIGYNYKSILLISLEITVYLLSIELCITITKIKQKKKNSKLTIKIMYK